MSVISLGPVEFRCSSGLNWSTFEIAWISARKQGNAQRETALRCAFKSEHLLDIAGTPNPNDTITVNGATYYGRRTTGVDGDIHALTASQVAARALRVQAIQQGVRQGNQVAVDISGESDPWQATTDQPSGSAP